MPTMGTDKMASMDMRDDANTQDAAGADLGQDSMPVPWVLS
jgi:hypothetical protein